MRGQAVIGYFGKIPSHGDFITRGLPAHLVAAWDRWLQRCILESRRQLGESWMTHYLTSPVWRFAISPGILGPEGLGGVMMPSVDRVGRYFPLMMGATGSPPLLDWFQKHAAWYDAIEDMARASLDRAFRSAQLRDMPEPGVTPAASSSSVGGNRRFPLADAVDRDIVAGALQGHSLWWSEGSPSVDASVLSCVGMPASPTFVAMLDGSWGQLDDS